MPRIGGNRERLNPPAAPFGLSCFTSFPAVEVEGTIPVMFEHRTDPLLPRHHFLYRVLVYSALASLVVGAALGLGVAGYHFLGGLPWIDALVNASMILGGMGPVDPISSHAGKLFASFYALFSGLLFIGAASLVLAPFVHRIMHKLHLDED